MGSTEKYDFYYTRSNHHQNGMKVGVNIWKQSYNNIIVFSEHSSNFWQKKPNFGGKNTIFFCIAIIVSKLINSPHHSCLQCHFLSQDLNIPARQVQRVKYKEYLTEVLLISEMNLIPIHSLQATFYTFNIDNFAIKFCNNLSFLII